MYRTHKEPRPHAERIAADISTPVRLIVHNGVTANFAFPCWYQVIHGPIKMFPHDVMVHDHIGWPQPSHPDRSCQLWAPDIHCYIRGAEHDCPPGCRMYLDYDNILPIHLLSDAEGYNSASVAWATEDREAPDGIVATAEIDPNEDWVVRLLIDADDPAALEKPQKYKLTVFVNAPQRTVGARTVPARSDIVVLAELIVLPSAYQG